jgi:hypothetical protein
VKLSAILVVRLILTDFRNVQWLKGLFRMDLLDWLGSFGNLFLDKMV